MALSVGFWWAVRWWGSLTHHFAIASPMVHPFPSFSSLGLGAVTRAVNSVLCFLDFPAGSAWDEPVLLDVLLLWYLEKGYSNYNCSFSAYLECFLWMPHTELDFEGMLNWRNFTFFQAFTLFFFFVFFTLSHCGCNHPAQRNHSCMVRSHFRIPTCATRASLSVEY